jgi:hypothetical protein
MAKMANASIASPSTPDSAPAPIRTQTTTLLNWAKKIAHGLIGLTSFSAFGPCSASNLRASAHVNPIAEAPRRLSTSSGVPQCQGLLFC